MLAATGGDFPLLSALVVTPLIGAVMIAFVGKSRTEIVRAFAMLASVCTAALAGYLLWQFHVGDGGFQFVEDRSWVEAMGLRYILGVDGISLWMVVLTGLIFPLVFLSSANLNDRFKMYAISMLILEAGIMGVFLALDLVLFFVFFEVVLIPMYLLIGIWGHERRIYAALKFFIYTMAGSALMLAAILTLGFLHSSQTGVLTFDMRELSIWGGLAQSTAQWLFLAFFVAFAVKVPIFPLHTWLPDAHVEAPAAGSVVLAAVMLKMGTYGFLRFSLTLFPQAAVDMAPWIMVLGAIGIIYGALVAAVQTDLKKLIAYSSVAHMGFVVIGTFSLTQPGLDGGILTMLAHGLNTSALFFLVGFLYDRRHTREIAQFGGLWKTMPIFAGLFLVASFASVGLPGLSGFVGEYLSLLGTFLTSRPVAVVSTVGVILAALYLLWAFQQVFTGEPEGDNRDTPDVSVREIAVVAPLLILSLVIGLYPRPVLDRINPSVEALLDHVEEQSDWVEPSVPPASVVHDETTEVEAGHDEAGAAETDSGNAADDEHSIGNLEAAVPGGAK
ncbi:MAG: NADH-quinone oxidoreductase subunit M [Actinobacteria bacterium]|nr:NADH-quinone oxidoreductase subunit M [Actinomycetota bacterium]MCB9390469.1 NADH-quinone oxidoreductase subunit M [Acidimicrobiia bacterium]